MFAFLALFFVSLAAMIGIACAINYFWRIGAWKSLAGGVFTVAIFLIFWASGLWEGASRHSWGPLTPLFFLIIVATALVAAAAALLVHLSLRKKQAKKPIPRWEKR